MNCPLLFFFFCLAPLRDEAKSTKRGQTCSLSAEGLGEAETCKVQSNCDEAKRAILCFDKHHLMCGGVCAVVTHQSPFFNPKKTKNCIVLGVWSTLHLCNKSIEILQNCKFGFWVWCLNDDYSVMNAFPWHSILFESTMYCFSSLKKCNLVSHKNILSTTWSSTRGTCSWLNTKGRKLVTCNYRNITLTKLALATSEKYVSF